MVDDNETTFWHIELANVKLEGKKVLQAVCFVLYVEVNLQMDSLYDYHMGPQYLIRCHWRRMPLRDKYNLLATYTDHTVT